MTIEVKDLLFKAEAVKDDGFFLAIVMFLM